jgi:hypothetical protein
VPALDERDKQPLQGRSVGNVRRASGENRRRVNLPSAESLDLTGAGVQGDAIRPSWETLR